MIKSILRIKILFIIVVLFTNAPAQNLDLNKFEESTFANFSIVTGQLLGSGFYHSAGVHGFGGVDFGVKMMIGLIPGENQTGPLRNGSVVTIPVLQANIGLTDKFDIGGRFFSFEFGDAVKESVNLYSGLVKYNALSGLTFPDITFYSGYTRLTGASDFSLSTISFGGIVGKSLPLLTVYAGANYNMISMDVDLDPDTDLYPTGLSKKVNESVSHLTFGISLGLAPFTKINAEYNIGKIKSISLGIVLSIF